MLRVLLVDDDINMLEFLKNQIPWANYHYAVMDTAENGKEALNIVRKVMPDLIVTDVKMPEMDGLDFCKYVQQLRDDVPIILLSAYDDMETARYAMKYNVTEYLLKPLNEQNMQLLCSVLEDLSNKHQQQSFYFSLRNDPQRRNEIAAYLNRGNVEWFNQFFIQFTDCLSARFQVLREACICMIELLYASYPNEEKRLEQLNRLKGCTTKMEMVSFVAECYDHVLNVQDYAKAPIDYQSGIARQIYDYVLGNYTLPDCGATMVSERFHFSPDYIRRIFSRYTGKTLNVFINQSRMTHASGLLKNTNLPINEVAIQSGFRNQNYFARAFFKSLQISPTEYRLQEQLQAQKKTEAEKNE